MSTDWNVHCVDCKDTHTFSDANHMDKEMAALCRNAAAIAGLSLLLDDMEKRGLYYPNVELSLGHHGRIDPRWFAKNGHTLVPIDEYGGLLTQCTEYVGCACGSHRRCAKDAGHDGDHDPKARR